MSDNVFIYTLENVCRYQSTDTVLTVYVSIFLNLLRSAIDSEEMTSKLSSVAKHHAGAIPQLIAEPSLTLTPQQQQLEVVVLIESARVLD